MCYSRVVDHRAMVFDKVRNGLYEKAISELVTKDSVVLDLGCGLGLHGLIAAKYGAKKVYFVEPEEVIDVAKEISEANNFSSELIFLKGKIEEIELPEKVDLIISVFTGNFLLEEDLLPSLFYARDKYLKKNGDLIPDSANMECVPVAFPDFYKKEVDCWSGNYSGIDMKAAQKYVSNHVFYLNDPIAEYICDPHKFFEIDFYTANSTDLNHNTKFEFSANETCHGILGWFNMTIGKNELSTAPHRPKTHWKQAFFPMEKPLKIKKKDTLNLTISRKYLGNWSWIIKSDNFEQRSSKLLSRPFNMDLIEKSSMDYKPKLNDKGEALLTILKQINNQRSNKKILSEITNKIPELRKDDEKSKRYLSNVLKNYCR